uniref:Nicotinamide phosphoribosyltransferase N-terminal domain-containing protein n=1 Tax=Amphimedon queenslandica TaxID=400682 RepID=A0A1X7SN11_AMPQE
MQLLDRDSFLKQVHSGEDYQKTGDLQKLTSDHLTLKYGISRRGGGGSGGGGRNGKKVMTMKDRQKRIAELAALYATKVTSPLPPISTADGSHRMDSINIDELVAWTEALDEKELENVTVNIIVSNLSNLWSCKMAGSPCNPCYDNFILTTDSYKNTHYLQYPPGTTTVYSYFESRGGKHPQTVFFGLQYILKRYFLGKVVTLEKIEQAKAIFDVHVGPNIFNYEGWKY